MKHVIRVNRQRSKAIPAGWEAVKGGYLHVRTQKVHARPNAKSKVLS